jgi:rubrerythrin
MTNQNLNAMFLNAIAEERQRLASRRGLLISGAKLAGAGALGFAMLRGGGAVSARAQESTPMVADFADDLEVLNYALTLEHLEATFYREGIETFTADDFDDGVFDNLQLVAEHEAEHVTLLTQAITGAGGTPVEEAAYDFGYEDDADAFLEVAAALENTGVSAYDGAGAAIQDVNILAVAGQIVAVEARHASYLNLVTGEVPFPDSFETPLSRDEVLEIAGPFITG